jgi:type I restriction enzyme M protein
MGLSNEELSKYWDAANTLREDLDAAEYKHIVLGLVFLKFISDAFTERRSELEKQFADPKSDTYKKDERARKIALDERDYYLMANVFWVPEKARWEMLQQNSKQPNIAKQIDDALFAIEKDNPKLEGIVERSYASSKLPVDKLGQVVDLIGQISFDGGRREASDILGQVYEYFLGKFANAEGKLGGQFYTTPSIVKTIVEVLKPTKGRVYDPACGSGGMFVQSEKFAEAHGGRLGDISIYGQESNPTTRRLCAMNLAIRGIEFNLGKTAVSTFKDDQHKDMKFDYIMMNPPFGKNASYPKKDLLDDVRWKKYGIPREKPANYAWLSHAIHHLAPKGRAGIVMPRAAATSDQDTDGKIRSAFLDDDIIECIIDLPGQLFFNVQIPATLWFFNKNKSQHKNNRKNQVLFIDARKLGTAISRKQIEFSEQEISLISHTFHDWSTGDYQDQDGFAKSVSRTEIKQFRDNLLPGRYIGTETEGETDSDSGLKLSALAGRLMSQLNEIANLRANVVSQLQDVGVDIEAGFDLQVEDESAQFGGRTQVALLDTVQELMRTRYKSLFNPNVDGWGRPGKFSDIVDFVNESKKAGVETESKPYVPVDQIDPRDIFLKKQLPGKDAQTSLAGFRAGDILFGAMRPYFHKVCLAPFDGTTRKTTFVLRPKKKSYTAFALFTADLVEFVEHATNTSQGSTMPYAVWKHGVADFGIQLPEESEIEAFNDFCAPLIELGYAVISDKQSLES